MTRPGYFDAPLSAQAFCEGQKDARPHREGRCLWRLRGRTVLKYTLVSFADAEEARAQALRFLGEGAKVQFLNYTSPAPSWSKKGPTEWLAPRGFNPMEGRSSKTRATLRRSLRGTSIREPSSTQEVFRIWEDWLQWASGRHFMVFKGHYLRWLQMWAEGVPGLNLQVISGPDGSGIFGWEEVNGWAQVTIAKAQPGLPAKALWLRGLETAADLPVMCGSTADKLKGDLGLTSEQSWTTHHTLL